MEMRFVPIKVWLYSGLLAVGLHVLGALVMDYILWKGGFVYKVMGGQFALLLGWVWFLIVVGMVLLRMRREYYLDPLRVIIWVVSVAVGSAPLKAAGEIAMEPLLSAEYDAYPAKRAAELRSYLRKQEIPESRIDSLIAFQDKLFHEYRLRQRQWPRNTWDKIKVQGLLGLILGLILGLMVRGGAFGRVGPGDGTSAGGA
jgi:hypothetical protein